MHAFQLFVMLLSRGLIEGEEGQVVVDAHVDCQAVISAYLKPRHWWSEKFLFAGWWQGLDCPEVRSRIGQVHKVAAHMPRELAMAEGWLQHWEGNNEVDYFAKEARPHVVGLGREWSKWQRRRRVEAAVALEGLPAQPWGP